MKLPSVQVPGTFRDELKIIIRVAGTALRQGWRQLFLADVLFKLLAFVVLVPLAVGLLHGAGEGAHMPSDASGEASRPPSPSHGRVR